MTNKDKINTTVSITGKKIYKRELYLSQLRGFYHDTEMIKVITGIRRCGKSCVMLAIIDDLLKSGIGRSQIVYINLDEMQNMDVDTPSKLKNKIEAFIETQALNDHNKNITINDNPIYLFLDEVQNVKGFEKLINAYRENSHFSIFLTGSNSYLLSEEISTKLTGRYISLEVFTLNFYEYLNMKEAFSYQLKDTQTEFKEFLQNGGFPKSIFYENILDKKIYLKNILSEIFQKDIKQRARINNVELFNDVRDFVINNTCSELNCTNIANALNAKGYSVKQETIARYLQILLDAKIIYECKRFDLKSKKMLGANKKYYIADPSFYNMLNPNSTNSYSQLLENITFLYAKSNTYNINVGKIGNLECDFIVKDIKSNYAYAQVATTILANKDTEVREFRVLELINDNYPKYVLTLDNIFVNYKGILHKNIADFMATNEKFS